MVVSPGPPRVVSMMISSFFSILEASKITLVPMIFFSRGRIIRVFSWKLLAPSTVAASIMDRSMEIISVSTSKVVMAAYGIQVSVTVKNAVS